MQLIDLCLSLSIPALILVHLVVAPYTKVEESFNIQATHDVLVYGAPMSNAGDRLRSTYDHFTFPGAVPRTFTGPVLLAGLSQPIVALIGFGYAQLIARAVLGLFNAGCLLALRQSVARAFGTTTARWFILLLASQFHVIFYASRPLPNMFAFGLTTLAVSFLLPHPNPRSRNPRVRLAIALFVFAATIFRSEVAILLATNALYMMVIPQVSLERLLPPFAVSFIMALVITVPLDSYFWQKPLWPELWGFYFNVILGSSSQWGVSPWHYYFTSALPRLLVNPLVLLVLIPVALNHPATSRTAGQLTLPSLAYTAIYSFQPHKEARFIIYVVPPLTVAAAQGANLIFSRRTKSAIYAVASLVLVGSVALSFVASTGMLLLSSLNYPGGEALSYLQDILRGDASSGAAAAHGPVVSVHADVLSCMTGVTLFGAAGATMPSYPPSRSQGLIQSSTCGSCNKVSQQQQQQQQQQQHQQHQQRQEGAPMLALDRTEDFTLLQDPDFWTRFDYVLTEEDPSTTATRLTARSGMWDVVGVVEGYAGLEVLRPGEKPGESSTSNRPSIGRGALVARLRDEIRRRTGGWWIGPKMEPRIWILRRVKDAEKIGNVAPS
ncbi:hypothetical protein VTK73DRAFT_3183 [Phialemonium thermophilum]|uniref:Mannosyltransferase n=1 Tax=Phialemonium thermophilum TaxID=223376 RepID=A0ABR3X014_9PEZI